MYKSLFSRLTVSFFITLLMIALIILITLSVITNEEPKRQFSEKLLRYMISEIGTPPAPERLKNFVEGLDISLTVTGKNNYLWHSKGRLLDIKKLEELTTPDTDFEFLNIDVGDQVVLLRHNGYNYYISDFLKDLSNRAKIALGIGFILLLLVLRLNYRFIHWLFYPIKQLKSDVLRISEGDINHHIKTNRNDELGELTQSVNTMADKLRDNIRSKRELLLAISHELRTPLARAKMHLSLMPANEYQGKLDKNLNELNALIEALLQSESLDGSIGTLNKSEINLSLLVQDVVSGVGSQRIKITLPEAPCLIKADELRIRLLISNLLNNALQYTDGDVKISLETQADSIQFTICDHGIGIAKDEIPNLTEAFYRPDKSRQRKTGSHGLGLYLCQKIVDAHEGELIIKSELGKGTCVEVIFPC